MESGLDYHPNLLERPQQEALVEALRQAVAQAPLFTPVMPRTGRPFSVRMTNLGKLGWVSDRQGYRYQPLHPETEQPWPPMPEVLLDIWSKVSKVQHEPEACLVNFYQQGAKMGLHQDKDEEDFS
ncbi:MAG: alpha-ketoglutarate-dependent dioxygenase AlkB, partial [Aestuariivirga sp.]